VNLSEFTILVGFHKMDAMMNHFAQYSVQKNLYDACHHGEGNRDDVANDEADNPGRHTGNKQHYMQKGSANTFRDNRSFHRIDIELKRQ